MSLYDAEVLAAVAAGPQTVEDIAAATGLPLGLVRVVVEQLRAAYRLYALADGAVVRYQAEQPAPPAETW